MNRFLLLFLSINLLFTPSIAAFEIPRDIYRGEKSNTTRKDTVEYTDKKNGLFPKVKDKKINTDEFLRDTAIYYSAIWMFRFFYVRNKDARIFDTSIEDFFDNITKSPEFDDGDDFVTNFIAHPFAGYMSYLYYREMEHSFWMAALGSVVQSTLFEYTIEGTVETPSGIDLIATPGIGVPLGYMAENVSNWLMKKDNVIAEVAARLINPMQNVVKDRQLVLFNPLKGQFEYNGTFTLSTPPAKEKSVEVGYPLFFESAVPQGYFGGLIEVAGLKKKYGGAFVMYDVRAEFPSDNNLYSLYLRIPQAGVESVSVNDENVRDGYELSNMKVGAKLMVYKNRSRVLTVGMETIFPTAYKDNIDRLNTLELFRRDFPTYLRKAFTITPYISGLYFRDRFSVHANIGMDNVLRASNLEGDDYESRIRYSTALGYNVPYQFAPVLFAEFNGYTMFTADTFDNTDLFVTSGMRFGHKYSPGVAVQIPVTGPTSDVVKASIIVDLKIRF